MYGKIRRCTIIKDNKSNKSKGYAFIEYYEERNAEIAYSRGNKMKIDGAYVLVDRELARTDRYWLPRRLGGGKGDTRRGTQEEVDFVKDIKREIKKEAKDQQEQEKLKANVHMNTDEKPQSSTLKRQKTGSNEVKWKEKSKSSSNATNSGFISKVFGQSSELSRDGKTGLKEKEAVMGDESEEGEL